MRRLSDEKFEEEWKNAEKCIDDLMVFWSVQGFNRRAFVEATVEGTMDLPDGELMTALTHAVMFERLLKEKKDTP